MGEVADMMLDGTLCEQCGEYIDDAPGYPQTCAGCRQEDMHDNPEAASYENTRSGNWAKRASNRKFSTALLEQKGVKFTKHNDGAHLIVKHAGFIVDFYPGTGKFIFRGMQKKGRGVWNLLKELDA